jgi:hypothetical protein
MGDYDPEIRQQSSQWKSSLPWPKNTGKPEWYWLFYCAPWIILRKVRLLTNVSIYKCWDICVMHYHKWPKNTESSEWHIHCGPVYSPQLVCSQYSSPDRNTHGLYIFWGYLCQILTGAVALWLEICLWYSAVRLSCMWGVFLNHLTSMYILLNDKKPSKWKDWNGLSPSEMILTFYFMLCNPSSLYNIAK